MACITGAASSGRPSRARSPRKFSRMSSEEIRAEIASKSCVASPRVDPPAGRIVPPAFAIPRAAARIQACRAARKSLTRRRAASVKYSNCSKRPRGFPASSAASLADSEGPSRSNHLCTRTRKTSSRLPANQSVRMRTSSPHSRPDRPPNEISCRASKSRSISSALRFLNPHIRRGALWMTDQTGLSPGASERTLSARNAPDCVRSARAWNPPR